MFTRPFHPERFLHSVYGTEPFADYCRQRRIPFKQRQGTLPGPGDARTWAAVLAQLPHEQHALVELELATVNEMVTSEIIAHLLEVAGETQLPEDTVPGGAPLALWFLVHRTALFHEVFLHHEIEDVDSWRTAEAPPGLFLPDLEDRAEMLAEALPTFFRVREGKRLFCTVEAHRLSEAICLVAQVADRLQYLDAFTGDGRPIRHRLRPARHLVFVYEPSDGTVLVTSPLRSRERIASLLRCFGQAVLRADVTFGKPAFELEALKYPFHPLPDATDMEMVRVKALHLRYPARDGRRQLKLETLASDAPSAIDSLLSTHVGATSRTQLQVAHAELQVRLRTAGGTRSYAIRLWPNRCNLNQTPLGDRFRTCLKRWGLAHAK